MARRLRMFYDFGMKWKFVLAEWAIIIIVAYGYCAKTLLDFDPHQLQQTGEQNGNVLASLLVEIGLTRYGQIPLWNPFMQTGFPYASDLIGLFWSPVATIPALIWGGVNGMKVAVFIAFIIAGLGQWYLGHVFGLRGIFRLWSGLTFMLSGGLALLWRLGWLELVIGAAFFPWVFASFWSALQKRNRTSLVFCAFSVVMIFFAGGGYYPFYLLGTSVILLLVAFLTSKKDIRKRMFPRSIIIAIIAAGLAAVMLLLPIYYGFRLTVRLAGIDLSQTGSQPILYALMNYLISAPDWLNANILGTANGWNWFYIGPLSIVALLFVVPAFNHRRYRPALIAMISLTGFLLLWMANRYPPVKYLYDWFPFLYVLRFPQRLLVIASSSLLVLCGISIQLIYFNLRKRVNRYTLSINSQKDGVSPILRLNGGVSLVFALILLLSVKDTYKINQSIAFGPHSLDMVSFEALSWLKKYDPGLYYTDLGGGLYFWSWAPAAYDLEMPIINDNDQIVRLATTLKQAADDSPFIATPKYQFLMGNQTPAPGAQFVKDISGYQLWHFQDALPFAFTIPGDALKPGEKLDHSLAKPVMVSYEGLNRIKVVALSDTPSNLLVVLVSDYPGWKLNVDGKPAIMTPVNYYLGAKAVPGLHTYTFIYDPPLYHIGLIITLFTVYVALLLVLSESQLVLRALNAIRKKKIPADQKDTQE
jgi:hypothetical protein